jgi:hypothetical protein
MKTFTLIHVVISLIAIFSGFIVLYGLLKSKRLDDWTAIFLTTTALTSITGFMFPFHGITPAVVVGIISIVILAVAIFARYGRKLAGAWRKTYVITAVLALYLNFFVFVAQSFEKIPALKNISPTQNDPPFKITQLIVLICFIALGTLATIRFRDETVPMTPREAI